MLINSRIALISRVFIKHNTITVFDIIQNIFDIVLYIFNIILKVRPHTFTCYMYIRHVFFLYMTTCYMYMSNVICICRHVICICRHVICVLYCCLWGHMSCHMYYTKCDFITTRRKCYLHLDMD